MTRTPKAASAARTGPSTTDSDTAAEAAPQAGDNVEETASAVVRAPLASSAELPQTTTLAGFVRSRPRAPPPVRRPPSPTEDGSDSDSSSDGEIPLCDAPVVKKRKVETVATSRVKLTDSERYKRDDAGCAERLKKREEGELLPCRDPDDVDDQGVGARFQGYDGFTISGPPVFR